MAKTKDSFVSVSYTHLDVYKRQGKQAGHDRNASFAKQVIDVSVHVKERQNQAGCQRTDEEGIFAEIPPAEQGVQQG